MTFAFPPSTELPPDVEASPTLDAIDVTKIPALPAGHDEGYSRVLFTSPLPSWDHSASRLEQHVPGFLYEGMPWALSLNEAKRRMIIAVELLYSDAFVTGWVDPERLAFLDLQSASDGRYFITGKLMLL